MFSLYLLGAIFIVLGALGIGGSAKLNLGNFGTYTGAAGFVFGIGCLVVAGLTTAAGI